MSLASASLRPHPLSRGREHHPIPFLRPFDSAHATAHLRQGERNSPHRWGWGVGKEGEEGCERASPRFLAGHRNDRVKGVGVGEGRARRTGSAGPPHARPFECLPPRRIFDRVSDPSWEWGQRSGRFANRPYGGRMPPAPLHGMDSRLGASSTGSRRPE